MWAVNRRFCLMISSAPPVVRECSISGRVWRRSSSCWQRHSISFFFFFWTNLQLQNLYSESVIADPKSCELISTDENLIMQKMMAFFFWFFFPRHDQIILRFKLGLQTDRLDIRRVNKCVTVSWNLVCVLICTQFLFILILNELSYFLSLSLSPSTSTTFKVSNPSNRQQAALFPAPISQHRISTKCSVTTYPPLPFCFSGTCILNMVTSL